MSIASSNLIDSHLSMNGPVGFEESDEEVCCPIVLLLDADLFILLLVFSIYIFVLHVRIKILVCIRMTFC